MHMLDDRGYIVASDEFKLSFDAFSEIFRKGVSREELTILACKKYFPEKQIFVFFVENTWGEDRITRKTISLYYDRMKDEDVSSSILVLPEKLSPQAEKSLKHIQTRTRGSITIETFRESELVVNITEHVLVPKHQLLTEEESLQLLNRYRVTSLQLPRIIRDDPVAKYLGLKVGDLVKIIRPSETAGLYVTYRACL
jgi:DNA-directed RNA polymerase I, II, and III subunit RPABC1